MMTQEELYKKRSEIKKNIRELERQVIDINYQIVQGFPFKVGDKIRFKERSGWDWNKITEKEAWITRIQLNDYQDGYVTLTVNYPRKDGSRSERKNYVHGIDSSDIEVIEKGDSVK